MASIAGQADGDVSAAKSACKKTEREPFLIALRADRHFLATAKAHNKPEILPGRPLRHSYTGQESLFRRHLPFCGPMPQVGRPRETGKSFTPGPSVCRPALFYPMPTAESAITTPGRHTTAEPCHLQTIRRWGKSGEHSRGLLLASTTGGFLESAEAIYA